MHLLSLLQDSFTSRTIALPDTVRTNVGKLVLSASERGTRDDKRYAQELAGICPEPVLEYLLKQAFQSKSQWLKEAAFRQAARLSEITQDVARGIRNTLLLLAASKKLYRDRYAIEAYLRRLNQSKDFLSVMRLTIWLPFIDIVLFLIIALGIYQEASSSISMEWWQKVVFLGVTIVIAYFWYDSLPSLENVILFNTYPKILIGILSLCIRIIVYELFIISILGVRITFLKNAPLALLLLCVYLLLFTPFALLSASTSHYIHRRWWILIPIWPLLYFVQNPHSLITIIKETFTKNRDSLIYIAKSFFVASIIIILMLIPFLISLYIYKHSTFFIFTIVFEIVVFSYIFIPALTSIFIIKINNSLKLYLWTKSCPKALTHQELCNAFEGYYSPPPITTILRFVRLKHKLVITQDTIEFLRNLALDTEATLLKRQPKNLNLPLKVLLRRLILPRLILSGKRLKWHDVLIQNADDETVDELYILLRNIDVQYQVV